MLLMRINLYWLIQRILPCLSVAIFLLIEFTENASNPNIQASSFCYDALSCGETTWGGVCNSGMEQSPIDLRVKRKPFQSHLILPTRFILNQEYGTEVAMKFHGQNNGHTAQFDLSPNTSALMSSLEISGGKLGATYKFAQLHFHWAHTGDKGSEHTINGQSYPLEMHIVHYKTTYASLVDALSTKVVDRKAVAVMAVFFKVGFLPNMALKSIVEALAALQAPGVVREFDFKLKISGFYPKKMEFGRYLGSLTTPTCDEKVIWTVFLRPMEISENQLAAFRRLINEENLSSFNYRTTKPLNGRLVSYYRGINALSQVQTIPNPIKFFVQFLQNLLNLLLNLVSSLIIRPIRYLLTNTRVNRKFLIY